ncbi:hypothetical protein ACSSS7_005679 [Eimeria intestinalis]
MLGTPRSLRWGAPSWGSLRKGDPGSTCTSVVNARGPFKPIDHAKPSVCGDLPEPGRACLAWRHSSPACVLGRPVQFTSAATSAAAASAGARLPASAQPAAASAPSSNSSSSSNSSNSGNCERSTKGPLNVVDMVEEGDILRGLKVGPLTWAGEGSIRLLLQRPRLHQTFAFPRLLPGETVTLRVEGLWPRKGKCKAALLGTELPSLGHRLPPCPHFLQGCSGCQLLHFELAQQLNAKQQLLHQLLQELLNEQQHHQQPSLQQSQEDTKPLDPQLLLLLPSAVYHAPCIFSRACSFAARGDFLVEAEGNMVRLGLPSATGTGGLINVRRCLRLAAPLQEVYTHLREALLPLLEIRKLRPLHPRSNAGCLSGVTLRLADQSTGALYLRLSIADAEAAPAATFADTLVEADQRQAVGTDTHDKRLWTALECGGFFALLLANQFAQVTAFAPGLVDAEETRKNFALNGLRNAEVVECAGSSNRPQTSLASVQWTFHRDCQRMRHQHPEERRQHQERTRKGEVLQKKTTLDVVFSRLALLVLRGGRGSCLEDVSTQGTPKLPMSFC